MKTFFVSILATGFLASTAFAEPMQLSDAQLDQVAAGEYNDDYDHGSYGGGYDYYPYYYNYNYNDNDNDNDNDNYNYNENNIYISIPIFYGYTGGYPGGYQGGGDGHYGGGAS